MKFLGILALAALLTIALVSVSHAADETTLNGNLVCAKCSLKQTQKCQDALVVKDDAGTETVYYVTKNEVAEKAGHLCTKTSKATVTGVISEKDGQKWIAASKIEKQQS